MILIEKRGGEFELTSFGRIVGSRLADCRRDLDTADRLAPFLEAVEPDVEIPLGLFSDATITRPKAGQAHFAVKRLSDLMSESESLRAFSAVVSPIYVDICCREARAGADVRAIFDRQVVDILFDEYASEAREAIDRGGLEVLIHDACPFELFLFDDRMGMTAHGDDGNGTLFVETDDPDAYELADTLFREYEAEAEFATVF